MINLCDILFGTTTFVQSESTSRKTNVAVHVEKKYNRNGTVHKIASKKDIKSFDISIYNVDNVQGACDISFRIVAFTFYKDTRQGLLAFSFK